MYLSKKWISTISFLCISLSIWSLDHYFGVLLEDLQQLSPKETSSNESNPDETTNLLTNTTSEPPNWDPTPTIQYLPGPLLPLGSSYTKTLIIPATQSDDTSWITTSFSHSPNIHIALYSVDDTTADFHTPRNKGHEVLAYLSYIVEQYDNLSDVNIFMHSHRYAWHNNDFLGNDAVEMVSRLSAERVQREGYVNLRCHWEPGCPAWMHPGTITPTNPNKQEQPLLSPIFQNLFPHLPIPHTLAQPCCAQFALSRSRIHALPLARYIYFRDWLLHTPLSDSLSGRVWEYLWQFVFTGHHVVCVPEHVCYCDGYGVCFGGRDGYEGFKGKWGEMGRLEGELGRWREGKEKWEGVGEEQRRELGLEMPEVGGDVLLEEKIGELKGWCERRLEEAKIHGDLASSRAVEAGREWHDGDGF